MNPKGKLKKSTEAVYYMKQKYAAYGEWLARAFLVIVENYYEEGKRLNAMETLKSLIANAPNAAIKAEAQRRLQEIQAEIDAEEAAAQADTTAIEEVPVEEYDPNTAD